jgi:hypothetical protein
MLFLILIKVILWKERFFTFVMFEGHAHDLGQACKCFDHAHLNFIYCLVCKFEIV